MKDRHPDTVAGGHDERDLSEMLEELRILLPGAQILTAILGTSCLRSCPWPESRC